MLTSQDITKLKTIFATKKELRKNTEEIVQYVNIQFKQVDLRFQRIELRLDAIEKRLDRLETNLDWLVGAFKNFNEELTIVPSRYPQMYDKIESHERRIRKLERKVN